MHKQLPQSTVKLVLPSNESYESKTGCNRTLATVLWVPLKIAIASDGNSHLKIAMFLLKICLRVQVRNRSDFRPAVEIRNRKEKIARFRCNASLNTQLHFKMQEATTTRHLKVEGP